MIVCRTRSAKTCRIVAVALAAASAMPAAGQELYGGVYAHGVDTPFTLETGEGGVAVQFGYRFAPVEALRAVGSPEPYVFASINAGGDTSFAGAGLGWKAEIGPVYLRPGIGLVIHDAPSRRVDPATRLRTDLGSRILFSPELAIGTRLTDRLTVEASWVHVSNAQLLDGDQNPGIDTMGVRVNWRL